MSNLLSPTDLRQHGLDLPDFDDEPGLRPLIETLSLGSIPVEAEPPPLPRPALLSTAEAAALFNREPRTLHRWRQRGLIRAMQLGRSLFYVAADIDALIAGRLTAAILHDAEPPKSSTSRCAHCSALHSPKPLTANIL